MKSLLSAMATGKEIARHSGRLFAPIPYTNAESEAIENAGARAAMQLTHEALAITAKTRRLLLPLETHASGFTVFAGNPHGLRRVAVENVKITFQRGPAPWSVQSNHLTLMPVEYKIENEKDVSKTRPPFMDFFAAIGITDLKLFAHVECGSVYLNKKQWNWVGTTDRSLFVANNNAAQNQAPQQGTPLFCPTSTFVTALGMDEGRYVTAIHMARRAEATKFGPVQKSLKPADASFTIRQTINRKGGTEIYEDDERSHFTMQARGSRFNPLIETRPLSPDYVAQLFANGTADIGKGATLALWDWWHRASRAKFSADMDLPSFRPWRDLNVRADRSWYNRLVP